MMKHDVLVLGAGMVGVSCALHLQQRGLDVALLDRRNPGEETSYGNAGIIQREAVHPYRFPRELSTLLSVAGNRRLDVRYHARAVPALLSPLLRYYRNSADAAYQPIAAAYASLIALSLETHESLLADANAQHLLGKRGWLMLFRSDKRRDEAFADADKLTALGVNHCKLDGAQLQAQEPALRERLSGAIHWTDPLTVRDPGDLVKAYARLLFQRGATELRGDATTLRPLPDGGWQVQTASGEWVSARQVVVALGPWSTQLTGDFGFRPPLFVKRGYHQHFRDDSPHPLQHWMLDEERGYLLAPMARGVRITTGAELTHIDAPATPTQLSAVEPVARSLVSLGSAVEPQPWKGARPCLPDMKPLIGAVPGKPGMWCAFGHGHQGFTLGPATGMLLAQLMTGERSAIEMAPFSPARRF
ncbi:NAD(P)/FAD-dependent oxidoreductase [Candidatus Pantoea multigeneris]|uniref:FAD-binding oxidoreductase n=1 Tax=Candidatus Pantoea multigeneris TaxID=2608357 RepID=A0ABX0RBG2_9GAMM|nr:FAD-dependent oxidoreductase [Pantoea multigeneris]NIF22696.1 FAD-binding oxidoreductase [Pantoea multigeneris]